MGGVVCVCVVVVVVVVVVGGRRAPCIYIDKNNHEQVCDTNKSPRSELL